MRTLSPVTTVLRAVRGVEWERVRSFRDVGDFTALWAAGDSDGLRGTTTVVWDGEPDGGATNGSHLGLHLTPCDLAAAMSLAAWSRAGRPPGWAPPWRLQILDMRSPCRCEAIGSRTLTMFQSRTAGAPWVHWYCPVAAGDLIDEILTPWPADGNPCSLEALARCWHHERRRFILHELGLTKPFARVLHEVSTSLEAHATTSESQRSSLARAWTDARKLFSPLYKSAADPAVEAALPLVVNLDAWIGLIAACSADAAMLPRQGLELLGRITDDLNHVRSTD